MRRLNHVRLTRLRVIEVFWMPSMRRLWLIVSALLLGLVPHAVTQAQRVMPTALDVGRAHEARMARLTLAATTTAPRSAAAHAPAAHRAGYGRYALWGTGIGAALGLGVGLYSNRYNNSGCVDCFDSGVPIPLFGAVVGAVAGWLVGSVVYLAARTSPAP